jgi:hypothetical protein
LHKGIASSRQIDFPKNCAEIATSTCTPKEQQEQELDEPPNRFSEELRRAGNFDFTSREQQKQS